MSELEGQSTVAFERLCAHFEQGQRRQAEQIEALQQQVERLSAENEVSRAANRAAGRRNRNLAAVVRAARRASDRLGPGLQDARRDVARAMEVMRGHAPTQDRDYGPSR